MEALVRIQSSLPALERAKGKPGKDAGSVHIGSRYGRDRGRGMAPHCSRVRVG
jgi:hypothetical protein